MSNLSRIKNELADISITLMRSKNSSDPSLISSIQKLCQVVKDLADMVSAEIKELKK